MKKFLSVYLCMLSIGLIAAPTTQVAVTHPTTPGAGHMPRTNTVVSKPTTNVSVQHPNTVVQVAHPVTTVAVTHPTTQPTESSTMAVSGGKKSASAESGSYKPSYKDAKKLTTPDTPKSAKLGAGEAGLGTKDENAAQKDAMAAAKKQEAERANVSTKDILKQATIPSGFSSKLKQKAFESKKSNKK